MDRQERQAITIYDTNFNIVAIFDEYISLIWKLVFNDDIGGFDLEVPATKENLEIFKKDYYVTRNDKNGWQPIPKSQGGKSMNHCQDVMIIEAIEFNYNNNGSRTLYIGGSDITTILKRRIFAEPFYISNEEYFGFFGKLGEKLQYRGLPIYNLFAGYDPLFLTGDFIELQDNLQFLETYKNNQSTPTKPTLPPRIEWGYPYTNIDLIGSESGNGTFGNFEAAFIRIHENYTTEIVNNQTIYHGLKIKQGGIVKVNQSYYMMIEMRSQNIVRKTIGNRTESYSYWICFDVPKPNNDLYDVLDPQGNSQFYTVNTDQGTGTNIIISTGNFQTAEFGDICYSPTTPTESHARFNLYLCSKSGSKSTAEWAYMYTGYVTGTLSEPILKPRNFFDDDYSEATITTDFLYANRLQFPDNFNQDQTPYAILPTNIQSSNTPLFVYGHTGNYLFTLPTGRTYDWSRQPQFQQEKNIKHESYYDVLADISKKYDTGLRLYPDSDLSDMTKYHYAMYDGEDLTGEDGGEVVEFSVDFENLISSKFSTDNSESANVAYISSKYPRNPADENITEIELTTYTPTSVPETIQRREVFIDKDISYRDGEGGAILQISTFRDLLTAAGSEALATEYKDKEEFNCEIRANSDLYHLNIDYFLGDKVLIRDIFGNETQARIQETTESWDDKGYNVDLKLVYLSTVMPQGVILTETDGVILTEDNNYIAY